MMKANQAVACRLPVILLTIACSLGEPMCLTRFQVLPVSASRCLQFWEFQALGNNATIKVIAVDVRDHRICNWKRLDETFEQAVQDYQQRIDEHRRDRQTTPASAAAA